METYITDSLAAVIVFSPVGAGFFLVAKTDKTSLQPCIDYRGLNQTTTRNKYPLPLLRYAFDSLLDTNANHFVRI